MRAFAKPSIGQKLDELRAEPAIQGQERLLDRMETIHAALRDVETIEQGLAETSIDPVRNMPAMEDALTFEQEDAFERFRNGLGASWQVLNELFRLHTSDDWRQDAHLVRMQLLPGLRRIDAEILDLVTDGDLNQRIDRDYSGTFGVVKNDINRTLANLSDVLAGLVDAGDSIASASGEISSGNSNLSLRTEKQASSLEETASSLEQLTSTVRNNASNAQQAIRLAAAMDEMTQQNATLVEQTSAASASMSEKAAEMQRLVAFFRAGERRKAVKVAFSPKSAVATDGDTATASAHVAVDLDSPGGRPQAAIERNPSVVDSVGVPLDAIDEHECEEF